MVHAQKKKNNIFFSIESSREKPWKNKLMKQINDLITK